MTNHPTENTRIIGESELSHNISGIKASDNPWHATGLEWKTSSPPPKENFDQIPTVIEPPYNYGYTQQTAQAAAQE